MVIMWLFVCDQVLAQLTHGVTDEGKEPPEISGRGRDNQP